MKNKPYQTQQSETRSFGIYHIIITSITTWLTLKYTIAIDLDRFGLSASLR